MFIFIRPILYETDKLFFFKINISFEQDKVRMPWYLQDSELSFMYQKLGIQTL